MIILEGMERSVKQEQQIVAFNCWEGAKSRFNERLVSGDFWFTGKKKTISGEIGLIVANLIQILEMLGG